MGDHVSERSRLAAALMAFFLGWLGVHRFYVGKIGTALLMVLTVGGFGIWATIDLIMILAGAFTDDAGRPLRVWMVEERRTPDSPHRTWMGAWIASTASSPTCRVSS
mgnify:CR=1 FL=1